MDGRIRACFPEMPPIVGLRLHRHHALRAFRAAKATSTVRSTSRWRASPSCPARPSWCIRISTIRASRPLSARSCARTYQAFGAAGLITSGAARDLDQVRRIGFPAFSNGAICSHGYSHIVDMHRAVRVGGITIHPGDLIHADANGVTTIPLEIAAEVARGRGGVRRCRMHRAGLSEGGQAGRQGILGGEESNAVPIRRPEQSRPPLNRTAVNSPLKLSGGITCKSLLFNIAIRKFRLIGAVRNSPPRPVSNWSK